MIPQETVDLILDTARIEDVIGDYVTLKRRGASLVACCPFHNEKTPSFYVTPSKGIYKCFGCGKAGSAVGFVMEYEHCSYADALRQLARRYRIEIQEEEVSAEELQQRQRKESLLLVSEFAQKFYADQLASGEGRSVGYAYFRSRGLEDETIRKFGLGWAPSGRTTLIDAALAAGYKAEYLVDAGLAVKLDDGTLRDKFYERAMFPIHSVSGRVVAFSGRTLRSDGKTAKYVNTADTEIYIKSRNLLGIYFAKADISRLHRCILVEGNVDMVTMHQLGICNVVASCGTSLTVEQIRLIHRFTEDVTIMYDGDHAGIKAALRGINLVLEEGLNVRIVLLPEGEDPDSFGRSHSLEEVQTYISSHEQDFIEFKTDLLLSEAEGDPIRKASLINDIADTVAVIPDAVKRSVYVSTCASRFGIEESILFERMSNTRQKKLDGEVAAAAREKARAERLASYQTSQTAPYPQDYPGQDMYQAYDGQIPASVASPAQKWVEENVTVARAEKDLLYFMLTHGTDLLEFESDSDFYSGSEEDKPTVADFISASMEDDDCHFCNTAYRLVYDAYMDGYMKGWDQDRIIRSLYDSSDRTVAEVAADLSSEKYDLSVDKFRASMTSTDSWLVKYVPRAILYYTERRIQDRLDTIKRLLSDASEDVEALMREMISLKTVQRKVKAKLGRDKL